MSAIPQVPRLAHLDEVTFRDKFSGPARPVIVTGVAAQWDAIYKWSFDYLKKTIGSRPVRVGASPTGLFNLNPETGRWHDERTLPFDDTLNRIEQVQDVPSRESLVVLSPIRKNLPELLPDFSIPALVKSQVLQSINLWVGQPGNISFLHYDPADNFLTQVVGRKKLILFPPGQSEYLYPSNSRGFHEGRVNIDAPDFESFPLYRHAKGIECVLHPGEMLFIPAFWWHHVYTLDQAISINFWWSSNIKNFITPYGSRHAAFLGETLSEMIERGFMDTTGFTDVLDAAGFAAKSKQNRMAILLAGSVLHTAMIRIRERHDGSQPPQTETRDRMAVLHERLHRKVAAWKAVSALVPRWITMHQSAMNAPDVDYDPDDIGEMIADVAILVTLSKKPPSV